MLARKWVSRQSVLFAKTNILPAAAWYHAKFVQAIRSKNQHDHRLVKKQQLNSQATQRTYCALHSKKTMVHCHHHSHATTTAVLERVVLPTNVKPNLYRLSLEPDLEKFVFSGSQEIDFTCHQATNVIKLNSKQLNVTEASVTIGTNVIPTSSITYDEKLEYVILTFPTMIEKDFVLSMKFTGELNDKLVGFYRSKYTVNNETRYIATTQFEANDARRAFPCFDEPAVKSRFEVTLIVPQDRVALSNMEVVSEAKLDNGKKKVQFAVSPIMSTYLLAFVVGEFDYLEGYTSNGLQIRVYTPLNKTEQGKFSLDVAVRAVPLYEEYFGQKFPLKKLDMIAIPDFSAGAMENWGLITYRETALLFDAKQSSASVKQWCALVVCHEIAHMWFGNLTTMEWWSYLWLNEGFATWVEYWAVDNLFPDWKIFEQFVFLDFGRAQQLDGLVSSHPIEVDIAHAHQVDEIFDAISYSKGCAVIRMLVEFMSLETFRKGLIIYLERHKYANATSDDLWKALSEASNQDIKALMHSWIKQTGYPVITVTEEKKEGGKRFLQLEQYRYLDSGRPENDDTQWIVPFGYVTSANPSKPTYLLLTQRKQTIEVDDNVEWIKFNPTQTGFYRVQYPASYYSSLVTAIQNQSLPAIDRLGVVEDVVALARAGYLSSTSALEILSAFSNETNYTVWTSVSDKLDAFWQILKSDPVYPKFETYARNIFAAKGKELGWDAKSDEDHLTALLRSLVLRNLAVYQDKDTIKEGQSRFAKYLQDQSAVIPDLRGIVYGIAVKNGSTTEYDQVLNLFREAQMHEEKNRCLKSLGVTDNMDLLSKTLDLCMSNEVRSQDFFYGLSPVASNPKGIQLTWDWFIKNFDQIVTKFDGGFMIGRVVKTVITGFTSAEQAKVVEQFFKDHPVPAAERSIAQGVETIYLNAKWVARDSQAISAWFNKQ